MTNFQYTTVGQSSITEIGLPSEGNDIALRLHDHLTPKDETKIKDALEKKFPLRVHLANSVEGHKELHIAGEKGVSLSEAFRKVSNCLHGANYLSGPEIATARMAADAMRRGGEEKVSGVGY